MRVLVTGSNGFIGTNLLERLSRFEGINIDVFDHRDDSQNLVSKVADADFIYHLAGVNRPYDTAEFYSGNRDLTKKIVDAANFKGCSPTILMTSSTQVDENNDYANSKRASEVLLADYADMSEAAVYIYRLPNVFGKWSRPNYNSVIATWCFNIARNLPIYVSDKNKLLSLVYIDDVVEHFVGHLFENRRQGVTFCKAGPIYIKSLGEIKQLLMSFRESRKNLLIQSVGYGFERALYATYLSFLPVGDFAYELDKHVDERGMFVEFLKTTDCGQFSISTTAPGVTRGNHYHNTKNEKFLIVKGEARIRQRQLYSEDVHEYCVSDKKMEVVEMIPGYTHEITNIGKSEMILLIWANENFDKDKPDTYFLKVAD